MEAEIFGNIAELKQQVAALESRIGELESQSADADGGSPGGGIAPAEVLMDDGGGEPQGAFRWDGEKITHCYFQFGRDMNVVGNGTVQASGDGTYYLKVPHEYNGLNASIITTQESSDLTKTIIPLFEIENGEITKDYRGMPVIPVRE